MSWVTMGLLWIGGFVLGLGLGYEWIACAFLSFLAALLSGLFYSAAAKGSPEFLLKPLGVLLFFVIGALLTGVFFGIDSLGCMRNPSPFPECIHKSTITLIAAVGTVCVSLFGLCRSLVVAIWTRHD